MSEGVISFPFRLTATGVVAVTGHGTDQEVDEAIAVLILTQNGERPMFPEFGVPDPGFAGLSTGDVQVGLNVYGPPDVLVTGVNVEPVTDTEAIADISWTHGSVEEGTL